MAHGATPLSPRPRLHPAEIVLMLCLLISGMTLMFCTLRAEVWYFLFERGVRAGVRLYGLFNVATGLCLLLRVPHLARCLQWIITTCFLISTPFLFWLAYGLSKYFWPDVFRGMLLFQWLVPVFLTALHYGIGHRLKSLETARD